jgi:hypothetical protein
VRTRRIPAHTHGQRAGPPAAGAGELLPVTETPHLVIDGPATLVSAELPQPMTPASKARQPARSGPTRTTRVEHIRTEPNESDWNAIADPQKGTSPRSRAIGRVSNSFAARLIRLRKPGSLQPEIAARPAS